MTLQPGSAEERHLSPEQQHEPDVIPKRPIRIAAIVLGVILVLGYVVPTTLEVSLLDRAARRSAPANPLAASEGRRLPPAPRLQVNPQRDIAELRRVETEILQGYGWVDEKKGIARVPIERAMAYLAEHGLPAPEAVAPPSGASGETGAPDSGAAPSEGGAGRGAAAGTAQPESERGRDGAP